MAKRLSSRQRRAIRRSTPAALIILAALVFVSGILLFRAYYTLSFQSPVVVHIRWPVVIAARTRTEDALEAQADQMGHHLTAYQQYACTKFGSDCRTALAIQRAENAKGSCEIFHYNSDGTLDWGYFQINTVHLKRAGVNLRDLLDCRANIDFAYQLYRERGFAPWSTYNDGTYRKYLRN